MKITVDLPDDLVRQVKIRAAAENRTLNETVAELLRRGLAQQLGESPPSHHRAQLPLVQCTHPARPDEEMTPERVAEILIGEEAGGSGRPLGDGGAIATPEELW